ncbi:thermonuclease family protein [Sphingobium baderi]|uniref:thermonuclease family protein n=1 Tax=Sphingobium baderi TaxID=1332080 RepID=UPI002B4170B7|nr:thermonuclease family protein [Sphingobium baderi]WRD76371.1 thermonuclease family protein [Sphingobium baderi]
MGRRSQQGFLIELALVGVLGAGIWVEKHTRISGLFVIVPALAVLVPLFFWNYMRPYGRRKKWQPRSNGWPSKKESPFPAWQIYSFAALLAVATFCVVFFWPTSQPSEAAALSSASRFTCNVSSITDGDTLRCADGTKIRLHAVAARESDETCKVGHPCPSASGASATAKLTEFASGQTLQCEQTGTSYNRVTAVCWNEANTEINCAMVQSGTTVIWPKFNQQRAICESK